MTRKTTKPAPAENPRVLSRIELIAVFALAGYGPREADLLICERLGATVDVVADYCWDHLMGEPRNPSLAKVTKLIQACVDRFPKPEPKPAPAPEPEVWTYAIIDLDLIRDDTSSAGGVLPEFFWPSREAARNALEADLRQRWDDYGYDEEEQEDGTTKRTEMPPLVLQDNPHDEGGLHGSPEWLDDVELYVYRMRPKPHEPAPEPKADGASSSKPADEPFCDACQQHKPCSCDDMAADRGEDPNAPTSDTRGSILGKPIR